MRLHSTVATVIAFTTICISSQTFGKDIVDTAVASGSFNTLVAAVKAAGLVDALKGEGPLTVLAPTDEAFAKLPPGTVETLLKPENKQQLIDVLTFHVLPAKAVSNQVRKLDSAKSLNGQQIEVGLTDGSLTVDGAKILKTDIACDNGVIHVIDQVILPATDSIPQVATKAGVFNTLLAAAKAGGLVGALSGEGPLTVFAPTDDAFAKLPAGTIDTLLKPENKGQLVDTLKYHVVAGRVYSTDALAAKNAPTLQGSSVTITANDKGAKVNNANLLKTDIDASNGVIHVIDSVLLPPKGQAMSPQTLIQHAIAQGAPVYNSGQAGECAQIYMDTAEQLLSRNDHGLNNHQARSLMTSLNSAKSCSCMDTRAWTMRRALDSAYVAMLNAR